MGLVLVHIIFLHDTGSNNPLGLSSAGDKIPFHPYFITKDIIGYIMVVLFFIGIVIYSPDFFTDPENYIEAKVLVTPVHIQPEWYFLPAYAILRSIPKKLGAVMVHKFGITKKEVLAAISMAFICGNWASFFN